LALARTDAGFLQDLIGIGEHIDEVETGAPW
jgi:hypothetical protein